MRADKVGMEKRLMEMKDLNQEKMRYLEGELGIIRSEIGFLRNVQKKYYTELLKDGKDIRGKGIVWIVGTIWEIDLKVYKSMLPDIDP